METLTRISEVRAALRVRRARGATVALVPTMGALHAGHLALIDAARARADAVVVSLFVNPRQFAPGEDLAAYPRPVAADAAAARERGVDLLFAPDAAEMYRADAVVTVTPGPLATRWEGAVRPGHFTGVLTVVAKLCNIVQPNVAVFGQKDAQQLVLIRAMVRDLDIPVTLVVVPTVRDADGLALSSRNVYLLPEERRDALLLSRALGAMDEAWRRRGIGDAAMLEDIGRAALRAGPRVLVDYLAIADGDRLEPVATVDAGAVAVLAARVGRTRLIDNIVFGAEPPPS